MLNQKSTPGTTQALQQNPEGHEVGKIRLNRKVPGSSEESVEYAINAVIDAQRGLTSVVVMDFPGTPKNQKLTVDFYFAEGPDLEVAIQNLRTKITEAGMEMVFIPNAAK